MFSQRFVCVFWVYFIGYYSVPDAVILYMQVNLLVVILGLWNGLILLPVLLSWMGPPPYLSAQLQSTHYRSTLKVSESAADNLALERDNHFMVNNMSSYQSRVPTYSRQLLVYPKQAVVYTNQRRLLPRCVLVWNPYKVDYEVRGMPRTAPLIARDDYLAAPPYNYYQLPKPDISHRFSSYY